VELKTNKVGTVAVVTPTMELPAPGLIISLALAAMGAAFLALSRYVHLT
jgi:hypothetical protein